MGGGGPPTRCKVVSSRHEWQPGKVTTSRKSGELRPEPAPSYLHCHGVDIPAQSSCMVHEALKEDKTKEKRCRGFTFASILALLPSGADKPGMEQKFWTQSRIDLSKCLEKIKDNYNLVCLILSWQTFWSMTVTSTS